MTFFHYIYCYLLSLPGFYLTFMNIFLHGAWTASYVTDSPIFSYCYINLSSIWKTCSYSFPSDECLARNYREHYGEQSMKECKVCGDHFVSMEQSNDVIDVLRCE